MSEFLWQSYHRLIAEIQVPYQRFLYSQLDVRHRLLGVVGPRGVGKTTLLLQYIKNNFYAEGNAFYFSADSIYFNEHTLLEFVDTLYQTQHIHLFFIDEIHKYPNWNQELKNIYDSFPRVRVMFSGSSSIDLITGSYDLSRRAKLLRLPGLSFREFLNIKLNKTIEPVTLDALIENHLQIAATLSQINTIMQDFKEYMQFGFYPIFFENRNEVMQTIATIIEKTIYEDVANFYSLKTNSLNHLNRILSFLASIPPGKVKTNNIAQHIGIDNKTVDHYLDILQKTGVIKPLHPVATGNQLLTRPAKIFLDNTTLLSSLNTMLSAELNIGTQRELMFMQCVEGAGIRAFFPENGDFQVNDYVFEVGGKNKTWTQLKNATDKKILVKDDVLVGAKGVIPLYLFGFLY